MTNQVVAIDGPAAAGKTTVARLLAHELNALLFDTGALYRAVTLVALRNAIPLNDEALLAEIPRAYAVNVAPATVADGRLYDVRLDDEDITWAIRSPAVDTAVSAISAYPSVREALLPVQRRIARSGPVVMVGRDVGTVVVPDASVKVYLDASLEERARRRARELQARNGGHAVPDVLADLQRRDDADTSRNVAPLQVADGAIRVETDGLSVEAVVARLRQLVEAAWREPARP